MSVLCLVEPLSKDLGVLFSGKWSRVVLFLFGLVSVLQESGRAWFWS